MLERWERRQYIQCLACGTVWNALLTPIGPKGSTINTWEATLARVREAYAFDLRRTGTLTDPNPLPF